MSATIVHQPWLLVGQRVPPGISLNLSFLTPGTLDPRITFTRASTGTYFDSSGTLQTATINTPRWDYNPSTLALNGLLIEEARLNFVLNSNDPGNASWTKSGVTVAAPIVTSNQTLAPDGTTTGASVVFPAVTAAGNVSAVIGVSTTVTANPYSWSIWLKGSVGGEQLYLYTNQGATTFYNQRITLTTAWQRYSFTTPNLTVAGWNFSFGCDRRDAGQSSIAAQTIYAWGGQAELGALPTSYIPTTTASVTRAAEAATIPTAAWFSASASSLAADFMVAQSPNPSATLVRDACALSDGTASNRLMLRGQIIGAATTAIATSIASTATASGSLGSTTANAVTKIAGAWNGTAGVGSLNGAAAVSYAVGIPSGLTTLTMGNDYSGAAAYLNGWVRRVRYWPRVLSASELQSVTR